MKRTVLPILVMALAAIVPISSAAATAEPTDIVSQKYDRIKKLVNEKKTRPDLENAIRAEMDTFVDYDELGRRTLPGEWKKLKSRDRKRFVNGFKQMVQRNYVKKFNPNATFEVEIGKAVEEKGVVVVESTIRSGRSEAGVNYAFNKKGSRWMVHDVIIDEVSMVKNYRSQFHKIINKEGFQGLMDRIEKKNSEAAR